MECLGCRRNLGNVDAREACFAVEHGGDEYVTSYWRCPDCDTYTVETYHDRFMGDAARSVAGPVPAADLAASLAEIAACPEPANKRCRCPAHRRLGD